MGKPAKGFAIPLPPGKMVPPLPAGGLRNLADLARMPGARPFPPGTLCGDMVYALTKESVHRNIYRVPNP